MPYRVKADSDKEDAAWRKKTCKEVQLKYDKTVYRAVDTPRINSRLLNY